MSEQCHVCGPVKHEAPILFCGHCAMAELCEAILATTPTEPLGIRTLSELQMDRIIGGARL